MRSPKVWGSLGALILAVVGTLRGLLLSGFHPDDLPGVSPRYAKQARQFRLGRAVGRVNVPDGLNELIAVPGEVRFLSMLSVKTCFSRVIVVGAVCRPLKVLRAVVEFVSVQVIDRLVDVISLWRPVKRLGNQSVDEVLVVADRHHPVSRLGDAAAQDARLERAGSTVLVGQRTSNTANPSLRRDFKRSIEAWNGAPDFFHGILSGCLDCLGDCILIVRKRGAA